MALLGVFSLFCLLLFIGAIVHRSGLCHIFTFVKLETKRGDKSLITSYHIMNYTFSRSCARLHQNRSSRATLIVFSVCGLFSIILLWLLASIYVTMAVALADFCYRYKSNPTIAPLTVLKR